MADPVSSVAYTIEASLRSLDGHLDLLLATQVVVLGIIALVDVNYWLTGNSSGVTRSAADRPTPRRRPSAQDGSSFRSAR
jgi:hypothetical protein